MQDRWRELGITLFKWVGAPVLVGLIGFYVIGPLIGGPTEESRPVLRPSPPEVIATADPPEREEWVMPSPPQVSISVEPVSGDGSDGYRYDDEGRPVPPPINLSDEGDVDEAGIGGFVRVPKKKGDEAGIGGISWPPVKNDDG
ncbi:MAG: hypothetical protein IH945_09150 [Armatimonadetes bacterium]|nr:hypothetical protein [Armatimonadota bacterium]